jgi:hypothetical protein
MHCELVVPGLFGAAMRRNEAVRFAALELLLARGRSRAAPAQRLEDWLQEAFELGEGPFPAGALTLLACGSDPGEGSWVRADPIHLRVMRDHLTVVPADAFEVPAEEADAFCDALSQHFAGTAVFKTCGPKRWCARLSETLAIDGGNPLDAAGKEVELPGQAAALLNEAQMVLHAHPANEAREARGEPTVNSLWLWGAGRATRARCAWQSVAADDPAVIGAARLAGARHRPLPRSARDWLERLPDDGRHLALLDALRKQPETAVLDELERDWFEPLLAALRAGRIGMVTVHVPDGAEALSFETIRADLRRFWRMAKSIEHYA